MRKPLRTLLIMLAIASLVPVVAGAAQKTGRYTLKQTSDGFMRLDTQTGAVAHCLKRDGKWECDNLGSVAASQGPEIARLKHHNEDLEKRVARLEEKLRALTNDNTKPRTKLQLPSDSELDEIMGFFEKLVSRFMRLARTLQDAPGEDI